MPSCLNDLTTRGVIGPKFFKSKRPWPKTWGGGVCIERDGVMVRVVGRKMYQREFKVEMDPRGRGQPSIQPFINVLQAFSVVILGKRIFSKSYIYHCKVINELSKSITRGTSNRSSTYFLRLIQNWIKVTNTKPKGFKTFTNSRKGFPKV